MKLSEVTQALQTLDRIAFVLPDGTEVPAHFHVTEVGQNQKRFVDCGGTLREETTVVFQLWNYVDYDHRLHPEKLVQIIAIAQRKLDLIDSEVEVEYQGERNIEKFALAFDGKDFRLEATQTACLAPHLCAVTPSKVAAALVSGAKMAVTTVATKVSCCTPGGGCC